MSESGAQSFEELLEKGLSSAFADGPLVEPVAPPEPTIPPETVGRHLVREVIGHGGMGLVLRAHDPQLGRDVAIKLLHTSLGDNEDVVKSFVEEAQVCSRLQHPGIVPVHEFGRTIDGRPYFAMKLVGGTTLASQLAARAAPSEGQQGYLDIFEKICQAVAFAHKLGVVHRDLKPLNVMLGAFGEVQVMDWGFALAPDMASGWPKVVGTPAYMSPEQARGDTEHINARADVFSLGAILCEILTGEPPYSGETKSETLLMAAKAWQQDATRNLDACGAHSALVKIARRCLDPDPAGRPGDAGIVASEITHHLASLAERARTLEVEAAEIRARANAERRSRRLTMALAATIVVALIIIGSAWLWIESDRRLRARQAEDIVATALAKAQVLQGTAHSNARNPEIWAQAMAAAREARSLAHAKGVRPDVLSRADALVADLESERQQVVRDLAMIEKLLEIRPHMGDERSWEAQRRAYGVTFRDYGLDLDALPSEGTTEGLRASAIRPDLVEALDDHILVLMQNPDSGVPEKLVNLVDQVDPDPWRIALRSAVLSSDGKRLARLATRDQIEGRPARSLDLLAKALFYAGDRAGALRIYRHAQWQFPSDFWINHNLGFLLRMSSRRSMDEVIRVFSMALAARPNSTHTLADLAHALILHGDHKKALSCLERAERIDPEYAYTAYYRGIIHLEQGDPGLAIPDFEKVIELDPQNWLAHARLGSALLAQARFDDAVLTVRRSLSINPNQISARRTLAFALTQSFRVDEAIEVFRFLVKRKSSHSADHYGLAQNLQYGFALEEATTEYLKAIELDANSAEAYCNLGNLYCDDGRFGEAVDLLQKGHALGIARSTTWMHPSSDWILRARQLQDMEPELARYAETSQSPENPEQRVILAQVAAFKGQHVQAARLFQSAFRQDPDLASLQTPTLGFTAACSAAAAGAGSEKDALALDEATRAALRAQALTWMRANLASSKDLRGRDPLDTIIIRRNLYWWRHAPELSLLREDTALARLPSAESAAWKAFWKAATELATQP